MKIFIWNNVNQVSDSYHCGGGLAVIAETEELARKFANQDKYVEIQDTEKPDFVCGVDATEMKVFIFPDAGCC